MTKMVLVIGITGGIGGATARALLAKGWRVRAMHRNPEAAKKTAGLAGVEWVNGDAMNRDEVVAAAQGMSAIVHGANPPGYRNWQGLVLPMLANTIEAARVTGARILFPGTVYNYGADAGSVVDENSPQHPVTRKGKIRVAMETMLQVAAREGVRSVVLRGGDFLGGTSGNSWFNAAMVKPGKPVRAVVYPGEREIGHGFAYLPDMADAFARLAERESELADFETFHFGGHWLERGVEIAEAVGRVVGNERLPIRRFPWFAVYALSPFIETFREMIEMRYLWRRPLKLDNAKLVAFLGSEPHTPLEEAVRETLIGLGCLEGPAPARARSLSMGAA